MSWWRPRPDPTLQLIVDSFSQALAAQQASTRDTVERVVGAVEQLARVAQAQSESAKAMADAFTYKGETLERRVWTPEKATIDAFADAGLIEPDEAAAYRAELDAFLARERRPIT